MYDRVVPSSTELLRVAGNIGFVTFARQFRSELPVRSLLWKLAALDEKGRSSLLARPGLRAQLLRALATALHAVCTNPVVQRIDREVLTSPRLVAYTDASVDGNGVVQIGGVLVLVDGTLHTFARKWRPRDLPPHRWRRYVCVEYASGDRIGSRDGCPTICSSLFLDY